MGGGWSPAAPVAPPRVTVPLPCRTAPFPSRGEIRWLVRWPSSWDSSKSIVFVGHSLILAAALSSAGGGRVFSLLAVALFEAAAAALSQAAAVDALS